MDQSDATLVTSINTAGIESLRDKDYDSAIAHLSKALQRVKQGYHSFAATNDMDDTDEATTSYDLHFLKTNQPQFLRERTDFVFRYPIKIGLEDTRDITRLSTILMYNLGLAHHLKALQCFNRRELKVALALYGFAAQLRLPHWIGHLAVLNNMGQIHSVLEDETNAKKYFTQLLNAMFYLVDQSRSCTEEKIIDTWEGFASNVMDLVLNFPTSAAAA